jgi:alpha-glucosidase
MVARAHALGLKLIIDQVYSHSSDQHPWFAASRAHHSGDHADWYVWADAKLDGSPPNNWQSVFGGPSWTWDARRSQYYFHNFLPEQPDLNVHNPAVQDALLDVARFWLERGVDGFRIDAINFAMHDPAMTDNPPALPGGKRTRPFDFQQHLHNQSHPDIVDFLERLRTVLDEFPGAFALAEVGGELALSEMHEFTKGKRRLDSAYGFDFLYADELTPALVAKAASSWPDGPGVGWPSWAFENHDAPRALSRWVGPEYRDAFAALKMLLLVCLRGNIFLYQGEELGLTQVDIPFDRLQDPEAIANWPLTLSRDGARTPMPWRAEAPHLGFSVVEPWLPTGADHEALAVDRQEADPLSLLALTRRLLGFRNASAALQTGDIAIIAASDTLLAFERSAPGQRLLCVFNIGDAPRDWCPEQPDQWQIVEQVGDVIDWQFGPFAALVAERRA